MMHKVLTYLLSIFLMAAFPIYIGAEEIKKEAKKETEGDRRAKGIEAKADRKFIQQDFDEAMEIYESAFKHQLSTDYGAALHLKTARLYLTLLNYIAAVPHYESAMALSEEIFNSTDVCNYLDALRFSGQKMKAISIARKYAYRDAYHMDQRYQNILHALNYEDGFLPIGTPEYSVKSLENANTLNSEFWVGMKQGEYFYASSKSRFHDPNKKFYHRSSYYSLDENSEFSIKNSTSTKGRLLDMIPIDLQNGPMSFSRDMTKMVITQVSYAKGDGISINKHGLNAFQTKLYYSDYNHKRKGWSSFRETFPQKDGYSYSHPYLFDNDRSLLFASDIPGGYGGYDIYVTHWNEQTAKWNEPVNLGAQVNTEGDEISPVLYNDLLIFSSNGHVGFGGYDIYGISYENGLVVAGSLTHFDYPINTVLNDFSLLHIDDNRGYIVSDRRIANKDDIYYFERNEKETAKNSMLFGLSEAQAISNGTINLVMNEGDTKVPRNEKLPRSRFIEHMLTLYFDFNSSDLLNNALNELNTWKKQTDFNLIDSLIIEGYADEIGTKDYNQVLSGKRAEEVAGWMAANGIKSKLVVSGKGPVPVFDIDTSRMLTFNENTSRNNFSNILNNKIWLIRTARRVDIKAIIK